ncbi:hypothetical protein [Altericroceibacterium endophyticum]|uniref:hypothetical protein n=1 Tax=Altericroceibacterium endophyticum TaxID=1808508 RepID=UPI001F2780C2|nr:hypothetical protein [Altericroceibacterium endophyticum]
MPDLAGRVRQGHFLSFRTRNQIPDPGTIGFRYAGIECDGGQGFLLSNFILKLVTLGLFLAQCFPHFGKFTAAIGDGGDQAINGAG